MFFQEGKLMITRQEPRTEQFSIRLKQSTMDAIQNLQFEYGATRTNVIQQLLEKALSTTMKPTHT